MTQPQERRRYKNPPIEEALVEFRFAPGQEWDLTIPGKLHEKVKDSYPGKPRQQKLLQAAVQAVQGQPPGFTLQEGIMRVQLVDADRRKDILLSATRGIDEAVKTHQLDALLFPGVSSANNGARPGYPTVTVPYALLPVPAGTGANAFPAGFEPKPAPYGVSFTGPACSEPKLIQLAFSFEQATKKRVPPPLFP